MGADMILVYLTVLVPVGLVGAYFWWADREERREASVTVERQEVALLLNDGYLPPRVTVMEGHAIRLQVTNARDGEDSWDYLDFPYHRKYYELPEGETVSVDLPPLDVGEYAFFSGVEASRGTLVVNGQERLLDRT